MSSLHVMHALNLSHNRTYFNSSFLKWAFSSVALLVFIYLFSYGAILAPDSGGYLEAVLLRSPGYPLFIKLIGGINKHYASTLLVASQLLLGLWATLLTAKTLEKFLGVPQVFFILFAGILVTPYFGKVGNYILTEGLAYPLFLFSICYLLKGLIHRDNLSLCLCFIWVTALVLTRGQFLFMYGVGLFGLIYSLQYNKTIFTRILLGAVLVGSLTFYYVSDKVYHKVYHGVLASTPFTGVHLIIQPLYLSNIEDAGLFQEPKEKQLFLTIRQKMEERQMSHAFSVGHIDAPYHLYTHFDQILYSVLYPALSQSGFLDAVEVDNRLKKMAAKLIVNRPQAFLKLYMRNLAGHLGGYYHTCLLLFMLAFSFFYHIRHRNTLSLCAFLFGLVALGNGLLVASVQALHVRYTFYADILVCCLLIALSYKGFKFRSEARNAG